MHYQRPEFAVQYQVTAFGSERWERGDREEPTNGADSHLSPDSWSLGLAAHAGFAAPPYTAFASADQRTGNPLEQRRDDIRRRLADRPGIWGFGDSTLVVGYPGWVGIPGKGCWFCSLGMLRDGSRHE